MTEKQRRFCDKFVEIGNGAEAARAVGYSRKTAGSQANRLLKKADSKEYIADRLRTVDDGSIATTREVLVFLSETMRGKIKDAFGLDPSLADRTRAAVELLKRLDRADGQSGTMQRLDGLLLEFRLAVGAGDDNNQDALTEAGKDEE